LLSHLFKCIKYIDTSPPVETSCFEEPHIVAIIASLVKDVSWKRSISLHLLVDLVNFYLFELLVYEINRVGFLLWLIKDFEYLLKLDHFIIKIRFLIIKHKSERHYSKNINLLQFTMIKQISKQIVFCSDRIMILKMIDQLSLAMHWNKFKHDLSTDRGPFEMKDFWKRWAFFFPHVGASGEDSFNNRMVVTFENDVLIHCFFLVFVVFGRDFIVLLFCVFLSLVELGEFLLVLFSRIWYFASVAEVFRV